jgi:nucleotide sugar dehydrogenase
MDSLPGLRLTVIGTGYLGVTHAACMAEQGFHVLGMDSDEGKIDRLAAGELPFYEPGLEELVQGNLESGRLRFTASYEEAADFGDIHFICVGTPAKHNGHAADLTYMDRAVGSLAPYLDRRCLVAGKSTVPVGTAARLAAELHRCAPAGEDVVLAWNPEFLREGFAVRDTMCPDRIVIGVPRDHETASWAEKMLRDVYVPMTSQGADFFVADYSTAELVKLAANSFLATKISFINAMAEICELTGGDVRMLADALACDNRINGQFLRPGLGFGGGCLPKDIRAFMARAGELGAERSLAFLREVDEINTRRRVRVVELTREALGGSFSDRRVGVLGATFKPDTDDIRDSPALDVAASISAGGAEVTVYDPRAPASARYSYPSLDFRDSVPQALRDAHAVLVLTDWEEFCLLCPLSLARIVAERNVIDGRHILDRDHWESAGWTYLAPGRPAGVGVRRPVVLRDPAEQADQAAEEAKEGAERAPAAQEDVSAATPRTCVRIGFGTVARIHERALVELGVETIAVLETDSKQRTAAADAGVPIVSSYAEAAGRRPAFWDICTPTATHIEVLDQVIAADPAANILIEKPICDFANVPRLRAVLGRHRGRLVVNENYCSSRIAAAVAARARGLGLKPTRITVEMTKNRGRDYLAGRFTDPALGAFGYEGTHLIAAVEALSRDYLHGDLIESCASNLVLPSAEGKRKSFEHQGTAFVTLKAMSGCRVELYTSMTGVIGHSCAPFATPGQHIPDNDHDTRYRLMRIEGADREGTSYQVAGFFEPLPGQERGRGAVVALRGHVPVGPPEYIDDHTVIQHLTRALDHFNDQGGNPCSPEDAIRHVRHLHEWAGHAGVSQ